jgi:cell division protein FtsB
MAALQRPALRVPRGFIKQRQAMLGLLLAGSLLAVAAAFQVNQLSSATSTSYEINELNRQRAARQAENRELEAEVAALSSLARVDIEARLRLGLVPAERTLYLEVNQPVPERQTLPSRFLPQEPPTTTRGGEPGWKRLLRILPFY